jgi:hypothetical protein
LDYVSFILATKDLKSQKIIHPPLNVTKHLSVTKKLGEVDVEHVAGLFEHDVVVVAIANPQHIRCHTIPSA